MFFFPFGPDPLLNALAVMVLAVEVDSALWQISVSMILAVTVVGTSWSILLVVRKESEMCL